MRKESIKKTAQGFITSADEVKEFLKAIESKGHSDSHKSRAYDYGIIWLYREFERLILNALVGAINIDSSVLSNRTGRTFPPHLNREVCEYIIVGDGYFDFKGRDGLIGTLKQYLPNEHWLVEIVTHRRYKTTLEQVCALRNYAAHESNLAWRNALKAVGQTKIGTAGSWLKASGRFDQLTQKLKQLAAEIEDAAPY